MRGIPLRLEVGPKDIEKNQVVLVKRHNREKLFVSMDELEAKLPQILEDVQTALYEKALNMRTSKTFTAKTMDEMEEILNKTPGFIKAMWCGDEACENTIKEKWLLLPAAYPLSRNRFLINVYAARRMPRKWYTGEEPIKKCTNIKCNTVGRFITGRPFDFAL